MSFHKIALIAGLAVATILPNMLIGHLIEEREQRADGVRAEFARNWGPEQSLMGPFLMIPYQAARPPARLREDRGVAARRERYAEPAGAQARPVPRDRLRHQGRP